MMDEIYGNAVRVCIWLGEAEESSTIALKFINNEVLKLQNFDDLCDVQKPVPNGVRSSSSCNETGSPADGLFKRLHLLGVQ
jgi:hypothetical protein